MKIELILALLLLPIANAVSDTTPPTLVSFDFEPKVVDVSQSDQNIRFTAQITDDLSGVSSEGLTQAWFESPTGNQSTYASFDDYDQVSGNMQNGTYVYIMTLPKYSEGGKWHLSNFQLYDAVKNSIQLNETQMKDMGFPTEIEVKS